MCIVCTNTHIACMCVCSVVYRPYVRHKWVKLSNGSGYKTPFEKKSFHFSFTFHGKKSESNFDGTEKSNGKYLFNIFTAYYYLGKKYLNPLGEVIFKILWRSMRRKINSGKKITHFCRN